MPKTPFQLILCEDSDIFPQMTHLWNNRKLTLLIITSKFTFKNLALHCNELGNLTIATKTFLFCFCTIVKFSISVNKYFCVHFESNIILTNFIATGHETRLWLSNHVLLAWSHHKKAITIVSDIWIRIWNPYFFSILECI